ncbi:MAG TPA: ABC transporter ATP-binding protein [Streptosporangiaceae bacterium]|jgi:ABC-2 type transport system ATP-binding protein
MAEPIIEARGLGIKFARTRRRKLSVRELFISGGKKRPSGEFWPLRDISFDVLRGEAVGVVGRNGTGKSTLLKLIAGVLIPDEGTVTVKGKVAPLLELRAGFNEELTGRENVYLLASLHGMKNSEIDKRFDEIIDFAEVRDFIDMPLRHYSSGMKVRLGFAVIAQLDHPVLLVDEVLAVGDKEFKKKCYATIEKMLANGRTLLLVSHNERDLERFCTRGLYIREGKMIVDGTLTEAMDAYNADTDAPAPPKKKPAAKKKPPAKKPAPPQDDPEPGAATEAESAGSASKK